MREVEGTGGLRDQGTGKGFFRFRGLFVSHSPTNVSWSPVPGPRSLICHALHAGYGQTDVLHDISFSVEPGEFVAIIGPNGGGKSTLLKTLGGFLRPTSGQILLDGVELESVPLSQRAKQIAYLPQENHVEFNLTVRQAVMMGRFPYQGLFGQESKQDYQIIDDVLNRAGLSDLADKNLDELSGGQRQRVWLASCLAQSAPILLLDEPTSSLDLGQTWRMLQLIRQEQMSTDNPATQIVIGVFHDLEAVKKFCTRTIAIQNGRIIADGNPTEILTDDFVAKLYGIRE